ncbi:MAG: GDSL-type esterase/lipase family protein [Chloroflexota bacterium]
MASTRGDGTVAVRSDRSARRPSRRTTPWQTVFARALAVVFGLLLPLLLLEISIRLFGPFLPGNYDTGAFVRRHPTLGHYHVPNYHGWTKTPQFTTELRTNWMGFRDPRQSYAKAPGTYRILALGDSYVEASQVQANQMTTALLERRLTEATGRPVEVINGGVFGYGTAQEYLLLDELGAQYQPDVVLLFFCHCNDVANNNYRLELIDADLGRALKPYYDLANDEDTLRFIPPPPPSTQTNIRQRLRDTSLLYNIIETGVVYKFELQNPLEPFNGIDGLLDPVRGKYDATPTGEWSRGWRITEAIIQKLRDRSSALGARLAVVEVPAWRMLDEAYWQRDNNKRLVESRKGGPDAPVQLLDEIADRLELPHLDLGGAFRPRVAADGLTTYYIAGDYHWTVAGNAVAADAVAAFLAERGLLPR